MIMSSQESKKALPKKRAPKKKPRKAPAQSNLTPKQERFCQVYLDTGNASEAYRQAYNTSKMKSESINRKAKELTDHVKVSARIQNLREEYQRTFDIPRERLLYEMEAIVNAKITDYVEFDGTSVKFKSFVKLNDQQIRAIESIKQNEKGEIELKLHGKSWSTERIAKLLGLDAPKKTDITTGGDKLTEHKVIILPSNGRETDGD